MLPAVAQRPAVSPRLDLLPAPAGTHRRSGDAFAGTGSSVWPGSTGDAVRAATRPGADPPLSQRSPRPPRCPALLILGGAAPSWGGRGGAQTRDGGPSTGAVSPRRGAATRRRVCRVCRPARGGSLPSPSQVGRQEEAQGPLSPPLTPRGEQDRHEGSSRAVARTRGRLSLCAPRPHGHPQTGSPPTLRSLPPRRPPPRSREVTAGLCFPVVPPLHRRHRHRRAPPPPGIAQSALIPAAAQGSALPTAARGEQGRRAAEGTPHPLFPPTRPPGASRTPEPTAAPAPGAAMGTAAARAGPPRAPRTLPCACRAPRGPERGCWRRGSRWTAWWGARAGAWDRRHLFSTKTDPTAAAAAAALGSLRRGGGPGAVTHRSGQPPASRRLPGSSCAAGSGEGRGEGGAPAVPPPAPRPTPQ